MTEEYYGAPREAGAYADSPSSSSQGYGSSIGEYIPEDYFENYRGDTMYPDFLKTYGHQKASGSETYGSSNSSTSKESKDDARRRILCDLDVDTLKTLLSLVRLDSTPVAAAEDDPSLEAAILDELTSRDGNGSVGGANSFVIDWNERFQELLASPDSLNKFAQLRNLANDFCFTAELYARIIISELYLPTSQKTIKPSSVGGVAGGQKFIVQGILFKFSVDVELRKAPKSASSATLPSFDPSSAPSTPKGSDLKARTPSNSISPVPASIWMYGGAVPSTEYAMKAAKHELRSTIAYFSTNTCRVPLVALVDFRGYRVLCSSMLPIDATTICYGSSDAGKTIHADADATKMFQEAGAKLNLKAHKFKGVDVCAPVDIEGHHGHDGNMYCIDMARLFPPEAPPLALHAHSRAIFFRLLRPELVRQMAAPLSSDAFTNFGADQAQEHNNEVLNATKYLQQQNVPQFAKWLCTSASTVNSFTSLVYHTHRRGINLRYLGLVRASIDVPDSASMNFPRVYIPAVAHSHLSLNRSLESSESSIVASEDDLNSSGSHKLESKSKDESTPLRSAKAAPAMIRPYATEEAVRQLILEEMIVRVLKCMLRGQWRKRMQEVRICTETPFAEAVLDLLNIVACKSTLSKQFWCSQIKTELVAKFRDGLSPRELSPDYDLVCSIELQSLVERFCSLVGVQLDPHYVDVLTQANRPFLYTDLYGITSTIHHMNIIDFAEGQLLALTARKRDTKLRLQLLGMAEKKLTAAHASGTHISLSVVFELANVHYSQAMLLPLNQCTSNVVEAIRCYCSALQLVDAFTPPTTVGKCHIRILRLFFEKLGSNVLLEETALQSQGIFELSLAAHLNGAAALRPKALKKIIAKATQIPAPEPANHLRSAYLPDCSKASAFGLLLTCLVHSEPAAQEIAQDIFDSVTTLNFQFCPQLLDPLKSGWMLGQWKWPELETIDFTACLTVSSALIKEMLSTCPNIKNIVLNQCQSIDNDLVDAIIGKPLERLELAFCHIDDDFFDKLHEEDLPLESLRSINIHGCVDVTDEGLSLLCNNAHGLTSISLDACPKLHDIRPLKKLKKLTTLRISDSTAPEPRLKEVLKSLLPRLHHLDVGCTAVLDSTFESLASDSFPLCEMISIGLRKTKVTRETLQWISLKMPKLEHLNITANEFGHGFGKFIKFVGLKRFECGLDKYTSGCDTALVQLKTVDAPLEVLNVRSCTATVSDAVLLMSIRVFPNITSLNISVCAFLSNAAMEAVSALRQLTFLSLSGNRQLVDSALIRITKALGGTLTGLEIAHCKQLTSAALEATCKACTELRYLDISFVEAFRKIQMIGTYCLKLEHLKTVGLTACAAESFQRLFSRGISLRRANFKSCPVTSDAVMELAYSSRFLQELCLSDCSAIDDSGISRLFQLCRYISRLELTSVSVSDASFEEGRKSLSVVRYLIISGCRKVTDKTLNILKVHSPLLEFINCSGCPLLSEQPFLALVSSARFLKSASIAFCPRITEEAVLEALQAKGGNLVR